jgi:hypothetical protein
MKKIAVVGFLISLMIGIVNIPTIASAQGYGGWWDSWRNSRNDRQGLEGTWYLNGDRHKRTEISASRRGLVARNEYGQTTRLEISRSGDVYARDWQGGLRGNVRRDRIDWANGTTWVRVPHYGTARYR